MDTLLTLNCQRSKLIKSEKVRESPGIDLGRRELSKTFILSSKTLSVGIQGSWELYYDTK